MLTTLLLLLAPVQQLDAVADTLRASKDKSTYENGAYGAAKELADMRSVEAMELRLELFDEKEDAYRGVYLRDWFYSGYLKAESREEGDLMLEEAANKKASAWHRVLLLRALGKSQAKVSGKLLLDKAFDKAPEDVRREWSATAGILMAEGRVDYSTLKRKEGVTGESLVRARIMDSPYLHGAAFFKEIEDVEAELIGKAATSSKASAGDQAAYLRILGSHEEWHHFLENRAPQIFANPACAPRSAFLDTAVENRIVTLTPALITALLDEAKRTPNRFTGDIGSALRALTGQGFGDSPELWQKWWNEAGEAWLEQARADGGKSGKVERRDRDTVARFFGLAVETSNVVLLVDGSGSMSTNKLGEETCANAAAVEAGKFLEQLPKESLFQVIVIEPQPEVAFKKLMPATKGNRAKAVKFLQSRPYRSTSALLDALEAATVDPLVDTLILVSDGGSSAGKHQYSGHLLDSIQRLHESTGVRIHSVLVTDSTKHEKFMRELAEMTGGRMVRPE
ncbi:MAG: vWA domain-containing protein [Planctomycetota bacterium]